MKDKIQQLLTKDFVDASKIEVQVEGNHCAVKIVSADFDGLRTVQRQQRVYASLNSLISSGELHAVTMKTLTPSELEG